MSCPDGTGYGDRLTIVVIANGDIAEHLAGGREQGRGEIPMLVQEGNALNQRLPSSPKDQLFKIKKWV